jgi:hypothetical protein
MMAPEADEVVPMFRPLPRSEPLPVKGPDAVAAHTRSWVSISIPTFGWCARSPTDFSAVSRCRRKIGRQADELRLDARDCRHGPL